MKAQRRARVDPKKKTKKAYNDPKKKEVVAQPILEDDDEEEDDDEDEGDQDDHHRTDDRDDGDDNEGDAPEQEAEDDDDDEADEQDEEEYEEEEEGKKNKNALSTPYFTDDNVKWLKPTQKQQSSAQLLGSDDDGNDDEDEDEPKAHEQDGHDEDEEDLLDIEREAREADQELEEEERDAEEEMKNTIQRHTAIYHLPTREELERDVDRVVPPSEIRSHVESILEVLADFKTRREPGRSRKEYIDQLGAYLAELHGYIPELVDYFLTMLPPVETVEFVAASDKPRPLVIRTNTIKTRRKDLAAALMKRGVALDPLASWSKVGLKIVESPVPIGATPEYLSGMYMLQSAASMCPVLALSPEPKEKVLDMAAAPGGKTSYMAQLMRNTGVIYANDLKPERQKATVANMHRLGVKNVIACSFDGRKLGTMFKSRFDRILLDAPCSGLGVISRDPAVKVQRTIADIKQCAHLQKELLLAAIDALKYKNTTGGFMVYSTCSVSVAENEEVVQYALSKRDIRIVDTGLDFGKPGFTRFQHLRFHPTMEKTRRLYPHVHNMDGFFIAKIQKLSDRRPEDTLDAEEPTEDAEKGTVSGEEEEDEEEQEEAVVAANKNNKVDKKRKPNPGQEEDISKKAAKISRPPTRPVIKKKSKQNAKVTKPRRKQAATDA